MAESINLNQTENAQAHRTSEFYMSLKPTDKLFVRRGQLFNFFLPQPADFNGTFTNSSLQFFDSSDPTRPLATVNFLLATTQFENNHWLKISEKESNQLEVQCFLQANFSIGQYSLVLNLSGADKSESVRIKEKVVVLFNPWCEKDEVYLESEKEKQEYVLSEHGFVYQSRGRAGVSPRPWNFDQFDEDVLSVVLKLLHEHIPYENRQSAVLVSRSFSGLANVQDENGILEGNWSGDYSGGLAPFKWNGSKRICEQYLSNGDGSATPVKYGQCWVFAGLLTSLMRCLGIPCRPVTNYSSAHDTDSNRSIEFYYDGDEKINISSDSIWNFHVWNEAWMARKDLPTGRGGWQAIDATPQETSAGLHQMGPASIIGIQKGERGNYDNDFVIAEVNADVKYFKKNDADRFELYQVRTNIVGEKIVTKEVGTNRYVNITKNYKHGEGTISERSQMLRHIKQKNADCEVSFTAVQKKIGSPLTVQVEGKVDDNVTEERTLFASIKLYSRAYHGRTRQLLKSFGVRNVKMPAQAQTFSLELEDYLPSLSNDAGFWFQGEINGIIKETRQIVTEEITFDLELEDSLEIQWQSETLEAGKPAKVEVSFVNPFSNMPLTNGILSFDGNARFMSKLREVEIPTISPAGTWKEVLEVTPSSKGIFNVNFEVDFLELNDVFTYDVVEVV